jgi:peptide/nickel transport system permease protein
MQRYILFRVLQAILCIIGVSIIVFIITRLSGDVVTLLLPPDAPPWMFDKLRTELGLDKPIFIQYLIFARNAFMGDFGDSYRWQMPAMELVIGRFPATIQLAVAAMLFSVVLSFVVGVVSAVKRDSWFDNIGKIFAMLGQAMPGFWLGLMMILFFSVQLHWLPTSGMGSIRHLIMPAICLGWYSVAAQTRMIRSQMLDILDSEYIKMGRIVGTPNTLLVVKYALKNALIPVITMQGVYFAGMLGGTVIIETIFAWPGVGRTIVEAIFSRDYFVVQAGVFFISVFFVIINLIVDILYAVIDPRIRYT